MLYQDEGGCAGEQTGILLFRHPANGQGGHGRQPHKTCMYVCVQFCPSVVFPGQDSKKDFRLLDPKEDLRRDHQRNAAEHESRLGRVLGLTGDVTASHGV